MEKNKDIAVQARLLSLVLCGSGHMLYGLKTKGRMLLAFFFASLLATVYFLFISRGEFQYLVGIVANGVFLALWVYTQMDINEIITQERQAAEIEKLVTDKAASDTASEQVEQSSGHNKESFEQKEEVSTLVKKSSVSVKKVQADQLYREGRIAYFKHDLSTAKHYFEKAIRSNKKDGDSMYQLGRVLIALGDSAGAQKVFSKYLALKGPDKKWRSEVKRHLSELQTTG